MCQGDRETLAWALAVGLERELPEALAAMAALNRLSRDELEPGAEEHRIFEAAIYATLEPIGPE